MIEFYNRDCIEALKEYPDKAFNLAIVDPPYGININNNMGRRKGDKHSNYNKVTWDNEPPSQEYFDELFRVADSVIIWGGKLLLLASYKMLYSMEKTSNKRASIFFYA